MGRCKALLPVPPEDIPLVRHITERLLPLAASIIVVANDARVCAAVRSIGHLGANGRAGRPSARVPLYCIPDDKPGLGPLGGLVTGLHRTEGWALTVAGDMPFVSATACRHLIELADEMYDAIVPVVDGRAQPLHGLYHRRCLRAVEKALAEGLRRMDGFWPSVRVREIPADALRPLDPGLRTFVNVNTPEEWKQALALLSQG